MKQFNLCVFIFFILFTLAVVFSNAAAAQTCRPPDINLVVLDKKGVPLDPSVLDEPKFDSNTIETFSYFDGGAQAKSIKALQFHGSASCFVKLDSLTLKHRKDSMKLVFNLMLFTYNRPPESKSYRTFYESSMEIRTPPFQTGTFEYVFSEQNVFAGWKKLSDKILTDEEIRQAPTPAQPK